MENINKERDSKKQSSGNSENLNYSSPKLRRKGKLAKIIRIIC